MRYTAPLIHTPTANKPCRPFFLSEKVLLLLSLSTYFGLFASQQEKFHNTMFQWPDPLLQYLKLSPNPHSI